MTARKPLVLGPNGLPQQLQAGDTLTTVPAVSTGVAILRNDIPGITVPVNTFIAAGYATAGDKGIGAVYTSVGAIAGGPGAIQDAVGTWFNLVIQNVINVGWFGAKGDAVTDDSTVITTCATLCGTKTGSYVWFPPSTLSYVIAHEIVIPAAWFAFKADYGSVTITNGIAGKAAINGFVAPDLTLPTNTNPGPMRGCCFYITQQLGISYFPYISGIIFNAFRFAIAMQQTPFSPVFSKNKFQSCNAGIFNYTGSENQKVVNNFSDFTNCIYISGSTCFVAASPYAGGSTYTDGLTIGNIDNDSQCQFSRCTINAFFDAWFVGSILQPSVVSVSAYGNFAYRDAAGTIYPDLDTHCLPSGRACFMAGRNTEAYFEMSLTNIALVTQAYRGIGLVNTTVYDFTYYKPQGEAIWDAGAPDPTFPILEVGGVQNGTMTLGANNLFSYLGTNTHPLIKSTGRGGTNLNSLIYLGTYTSPVTNLPVIGFNTSNLCRTNEQINLVENTDNTFYVPSSGIQAGNNFSTGEFYTDQNIHTLKESVPTVFYLPAYNPANLTWYSDVTFNSIQSFFNAGPAGKLSIDVLNLTEPAWDHGEYMFEYGGYGGVTETLVTAADINNGDAYIAVTSDPSTTARFVRWNIAAGVYVVQDYYDSATKRIYVLGGKVTGLAALVASGSNITRAQTATVLKPFSRGFVTFGLGLVPFSNGWNFTIKNNVQAYTDTVTKPSLYVALRCMSYPGMAEKLYANAAPVAGQWLKGAIVWNTNPASAGFIGWVCTVSGTPGTWKTFGVIS